MNATADRVQACCAGFLVPAWYSSAILRVTDMDPRLQLHSASVLELDISPTHRVTVVNCAFVVAAAHVRNGLPSYVISSLSLPTFERQLKMYYSLPAHVKFEY